MVEVILRKDVADLGSAGDMVRVAPGYARNYLIPQGVALLATAGNQRAIEAERRRIERARARRVRNAMQIAKELDGQSVTFTRRAGEGGRLFGSVTAADIVGALEERGLRVERRMLQLEDPVKEVGEHDVPVRVPPDVEAVLRVRVVAEEAEEQM